MEEKKKFRKKVFVIAAFIVLLCIIGTVIFMQQKKMRSMKDRKGVVTQQTAAVEKQDISSSISVTGTIASADARDVSASVKDVEVTAVNVSVGDYVNAGDTIVSLAIAVIAGISLLVGGIGVMNIMLVSITERTREIGTRKALGATNGSIRLQFIMESVVICLLGGATGIILGLTLGSIATKMLGYAAKASVVSIVFSVVFSIFIGVFFGYYPANKAAKLNPIEALRYE